MVSSVSSVPYSYLNQLLGTSAATAAGASSASGASSNAVSTAVSSAASTGSGSGSSTASSLVSSLLGGASSGGYSSEVLSLLQENGSGSFDPITSLLGGASTNDGLTSVYSNLFASSLAATLQQAQTGGSEAKASTSSTAADPVESLVNAYTQASISYNTANQQNIAAAVSALATDVTG